MTSGAPTVLLVDNEKVIRKLLRLALERRGYNVLEAADGQRALALARAHTGPIELLLAEERLAKMDGTALAEALEAERGEIRVVLMSAQPVTPGPRRVVRKPFAVWALLSELDVELEKKPPARAAQTSRNKSARNGG